MKQIGLSFVLGLGSLAIWAQVPNPTSDPAPPPPGNEPVPVFRTEVVARTIQAVNYRQRRGETKVDFEGTALMPRAKGTAEIGTKRAYTEVDVTFKNMEAPQKYGPEFLTYVLWAITPEGRPTNLGEVIPKDDGSVRLEVTSELASFGMIVTAEPYWAVTQPSDVVVLQNVARYETTGPKDVIEARYELLQRGMYRYDRNRTRPGPPLQIDKRNPLDLYEARNALMIARAFGAEQYAPDVYQKALGFLNQAEDYSQRKQPVRAIQTVARNAVQTAEDARAITVRRMDEERIAMERKRTEDRRRAAETKAREEEASRLEAEERARTEAAQRATAEQGRLLEEQRRVQAETDRARADQQRTALEERLKQEAASRERIEQERAALEQRLTQERAAMEQRIAQEAESRQAAERAKAEAEAAAAQASRLKAEAETAQRQLAEQQQLARAEADRARASADEADRLRQQAERDRQAAIKDRETLRNELRQQFSSILETRDTARGLIVNISDVLFDTGQYTLRPAAREKLARLAGIVLAHPGLHLQLEGHTDSVGSDALNQRLSENRANAVKQYLVSQGVKDANIESRGFGKTQPVASNATAAGRQQNRRVEMVVSGDIIGTPIQTSRTTGQ